MIFAIVVAIAFFALIIDAQNREQAESDRLFANKVKGILADSQREREINDLERGIKDAQREIKSLLKQIQPKETIHVTKNTRNHNRYRHLHCSMGRMSTPGPGPRIHRSGYHLRYPIRITLFRVIRGRALHIP